MENSEKKTVSRKVIDREVIMRKYHVHIKNFRNLKDVKVTLSPLTILTGENGSGKSTLFKALLFLKHNHDHEAAKKLKYVIDDDINLGGWDQIANDPKKPISIKITEETWGYDHEVEEIYDIDNCPFELNPTEEYAEKLVDKFMEDLCQSSVKNGFIPLGRETVKGNSKLTRNRDSREFIFTDDQLSNINYILSDTIKFTIRYLVRPFEPNISILDGQINPSKIRSYYCEFSNISCSDRKYTEIFGKVVFYLFKYFFRRNLWGPSNNEFEWSKINERLKDNFIEIVCEPSVIKTDSIFSVYLGLLLNLSFGEIEAAHLQILTSYVSKIIASENYKLPKEFDSMLLMGTTREIPKSRFFEETINENSYYGLFKYYQHLDYTDDLIDQTMKDYHTKTFHNWVLKFDFGEGVYTSNVDQIQRILLKQSESKNINLSEASSGTLQLLPVLFLITINNQNNLLFSIQQPELHLHPRLHSILVDYFIEHLSPTRRQNAPVWELVEVSDDELEEKVKALNDKNYDFQKSFKKGNRLEFLTVPTHLIIETHSEHLLKKLQVLVSQGKTLQLWPEGHCSGEDVKLKDALSIYYFAKDKNGNTKAIEMELDDNGFFKTETPKGFFDESLELNRQLLLGRN